MQILTNLYQVPGVTANVYVLVDSQGLTLIDTGLPRQDSKILAFIRSLGYVPDDLKCILLTHADSDHVGSLAALKAATPARALTSAIEAQAIQQGKFSRSLKLSGWRKWLFDTSTRVFKVGPAHIDEIITAGQELNIYGGIHVLGTPGHTPGHLSFFANQQRILFAGDSLRCTNGIIRVSSGVNTWEEHTALQSALEQANIGAQVVCAGHGPVIRDAEEQLASLVTSLENKD